MRFLANVKISAHKYKTPEGYLICEAAILCRTGPQEYRKNEIFLDSDDDSIIIVYRTPEEVFSPETIASFEGKPITVEHPDVDVTSENWKDYTVGEIRNPRKAVVDSQEVMVADLWIRDAQTIKEIENGEHCELSCGYDCDIKDEDHPQQRNIRGNHVALCERGRAGIARIIDTAIKDADPNTIEFLIKDEEEAIKSYEDALKAAKAKGDEVAAARYQHIMEEELEHIAELKSLLSDDIHDSIKDTLNIFIYTHGKDFEISTEYEDGKIWNGPLNNAIDNYCKHKGIDKYSVNWYLNDKKLKISDCVKDSSYMYKGIAIIQTSYGWKFRINGQQYEVDTDKDAEEIIDSIKGTHDADEYVLDIRNLDAKTVSKLLEVAKQLGMSLIDRKAAELVFIGNDAQYETLKRTVNFKDSVRDSFDYKKAIQLVKMVQKVKDGNRFKSLEEVKILIKKLRMNGFSEDDIVDSLLNADLNGNYIFNNDENKIRKMVQKVKDARTMSISGWEWRNEDFNKAMSEAKQLLENNNLKEGKKKLDNILHYARQCKVQIDEGKAQLENRRPNFDKIIEEVEKLRQKYIK